MRWDIDYEAVLWRLRELRKAYGYTQRDISSLVNGTISNSAISRIERGISPLTMTLFIRLCEIYQADMRWILTGETITESLKGRRES